jgi:NADPH2:quinone reductase
MKAVICSSLGSPETLTVGSIDPPKLGPGQVRIAVHAAGVNFPDTLIIAGRYQFKPPLPFVPGGEAAGVITELGPGVSNFKIGDRVVALTLWGAFAEELVAYAQAVLRIPDELDFATASGLTITYGTAMHSLRQRANLRDGQTVLVLGAAGGVGLAAVECARMLGGTVIAAAGSEEKLALAREYGASHTINYRTDDLRKAVKALTEGRGVDVALDPVGGELAEAAVRSMAWEGTYLVVGFASGQVPSIKANLLLLKGCQAAGVFGGEFVKRDPKAHAENMAMVFAGIADGRIKPLISAKLPLEEVADALKTISSRSVRGKIVLTTGREEKRDR